MEKDIFDFVIYPTAKEYRKTNIINKIAWIPKLEIKNNSSSNMVKEQFINDAIINYNNEIIMAKTFYANMLKYRRYFENKKNKEYDIWTKKYAEQTIKELFSIYDKSFHIINYLYDFRVTQDSNFKKKIKEYLKKADYPFYKNINNISKKIFGDGLKNGIRDDITHNFSGLFLKYNPIYTGYYLTGWEEVKSLSYDDYKNIIDKTCELLSQQRSLIVNKIAEFYPNKSK